MPGLLFWGGLGGGEDGFLAAFRGRGVKLSLGRT